MRLKNFFFAGSKPTMPSEYVSTGHNRVEERYKAAPCIAKGLWLVQQCSVISADSLLGLMY